MATAPPMSRLPPHMSQTRLISARPARRLGSSFAGVGGVGSGALSRFVIAGWASGSEPRSFGLTMAQAENRSLSALGRRMEAQAQRWAVRARRRAAPSGQAEVG